MAIKDKFSVFGSGARIPGKERFWPGSTQLFNQKTDIDFPSVASRNFIVATLMKF